MFVLPMGMPPPVTVAAARARVRASVSPRTRKGPLPLAPATFKREGDGPPLFPKPCSRPCSLPCLPLPHPMPSRVSGRVDADAASRVSLGSLRTHAAGRGITAVARMAHRNRREAARVIEGAGKGELRQRGWGQLDINSFLHQPSSVKKLALVPRLRGSLTA